MRAPALWTLGLAGSLTAHAALAAVLALSVNPQEVSPQRPVETQMSLAAYRVPQSEAAPADPGGEALPEAQATGAAAVQGAVPQSRAEAAALPATVAAAAPVAGAAVQGLAATGAAAAAAAPEPAARLSAAVPDTAPRAAAVPAPAATAAAALPQTPAVGTAALPSATVTTAALPSASLTTAALPHAAAAGAAAPAAPRASTLAPAATAVAAAVAPTAPALSARPAPAAQAGAVQAASLPLASAAPVAAALPQATAAAPEAAAADLPAATLASAAPPAEAAADLPPPASFATAALAWSAGDGATLDPASLAAIEAFMQPGDPSAAAQEARDGIEGLLASVPCARLQTEFIPETGALELRGHIPEEGMRGPVLAALQGEVGASLPVADNLLILPRPQCGALAGIADVGLPQSTDQLTNPRIVGADAHAREFRFAAGDAFVLEMVAPDYAAHVYVDYFDADGNVLHLVPNEYVALENHAPAQAFPVAEALNITIGPPYGQEIAVAFAASQPLYEGLRPIQEPAAPYLDWLKERVAEARTEDPDFKGEWVYFFVTTRATR